MKAGRRFHFERQSLDPNPDAGVRGSRPSQLTRRTGHPLCRHRQGDQRPGHPPKRPCCWKAIASAALEPSAFTIAQHSTSIIPSVTILCVITESPADSLYRGASCVRKQKPRSLGSGAARVVKSWLEDQLRSQLEFTGIEGRSYLTKLARRKIVAEATVLPPASELRVVPRVEGISAELEARAPRFADYEALEERKVPVITTGTTQGVKAQVAPCSWCRSGKRGGIDPLNTG